MSVSEHRGHVHLCDVVTEEGLKLQRVPVLILLFDVK